jgi:antitoxin CptB
MGNRKVHAMTGLVRSSADLDPRRRRILYRCWHRGIREMDLVLGQFAEDQIADLSDTELDELEVIMAEQDLDLVKMVTGAMPVPDRFQTPLFERIASYRPDFDLVLADANGTPAQ